MSSLRRFILPGCFSLLLLVPTMRGQEMHSRSAPAPAPRAQLLEEAARRFRVQIFFRPQDLPPDTLALNAWPEHAGDALERILQGTGLAFEPYSHYAWFLYDPGRLERVLRPAAPREAPETVEHYRFGTPGQPTAPTLPLQGFITDDHTGDILIGATLLEEKSGQGTNTEVTGQYLLELPPGNYRFLVQSVGYQPKIVEVELWDAGTLDLTLSREPIDLKEVVVEAAGAEDRVRSTQLGMEKLGMKTIQKLPAFLGEVDIVKSLLLLPGVSTVGEGSAGFNVRGGTVDQNLIMQDGAFLFNASHVLGFFSLFNPDVVESVTLYKSSLPARFGGRLASALDVRIKEGNYQRWRVKGGVGLVSSRLTVDGPLRQGSTALLFGGRSSYSNWVLRQVNEPDVRKSSAFFYDLNAKLTHRWSNNAKISASGYWSHDRFRFSDQFAFRYRTGAANLSYSRFFGEKLSTTLNTVFSDYDSELEDLEGSDAFRVLTGARYLKLAPQTFWNPAKNHALNAGLEAVLYRIRPGTLQVDTANSNTIPRRLEPEEGRELSAYLSDTWNLSPRLSLEVGLRATLFQNLGPGTVFEYAEGQPRSEETLQDSLRFGSGEIISSYHSLEPRLSLKVQLDPASSVKAGFHRSAQFINQVSNTASVTPVDVWLLSNRHILPQRADNFSLGYYRLFEGGNWESSLELYYRRIENVLEYKDLAELLANEHLETELLQGEGRSYGVEFSLKRRVGRWNGWLGYTYSRSLRRVAGPTPEETINRGEWFPSNFDKPHDLSLVLSYQVSRRLNISANFTYSTGRPITAPVGRFSSDNVINIPVFSERNQQRVPDYHRLDLSLTLDPGHKKGKKWRSSFTLSVYNLYARRNAYSVFFTQAPFARPMARRLAVLGTAFPALTYNFHWQ